MAFFLRIFIAGFLSGILAASIIKPPFAWHPACPSSAKSIEGYVTDFPESMDTAIRYQVSVGASRVFLINPHFPEFTYGNTLKMEGKLFPLEGTFKRYAAVSGICAVMRFPKITVLQSQQGSIVMRTLFAFRKQFVERLEQIFHEPRATLAGSLLLGKNGEAEYDEAFRKSGLSHITALSGFNITILISFLAVFTNFLTPKSRFFLSVSIIMLFLMLTGGAPSTVRAGIMGIFGLLAAALGRQYHALHALLIVVWIMVLAEPLILAYDIGFQLSVAATLGIILFGKHISRFLNRFSMPEFAVEAFATTLSAQIFTMPLIVIFFGNFNPLLLFSNLLVIPLIPFVMLFVFLAGGLHVLHPFFAFIPGWYADILLRWMIGIARFFSRFAIQVYTR